MTNIDFYEYGLGQIACASGTFCVAADGIGDIITGVAGVAEPPTNTQPPTISGPATEGQTLIETHGTWANNPISYAYEWRRCDSSGNNCQPISGATGPSYTLTTSDVSSAIRVAETASNAEGSSAPAVSAPTAVVQAVSSSSGQNSSGTTGSGTSSGSGTEPGTGIASINAAQIKASLARQLVPTGKAAKIAALLKSGGYLLPFTALEAGTVVVQWYLVPHGAKLAKKAKSRSKAKPILVASGKQMFSGAGHGTINVRLTAAGKRLLKHVKSLKLMAKGTFSGTGSQPVSIAKNFVLRR
jgi:hypothetical protein